jgi:hypothetical protein
MRLGAQKATRRRRWSLVLALSGPGLLLAACGEGASRASAPGRAPAPSPTVPVGHPSSTASSAAAPRREVPTTATTASGGPTDRAQAPTASGKVPTSAVRKTAPVRTATAKPWAPTGLQPTISQAAYALVEAWAAHNRPQALADATPGAVAALFSYTYPPGGPQFRGCSTPPGNEPASCVYRSGDDLLSLTVSLYHGGYAVTAATMES